MTIVLLTHALIFCAAGVALGLLHFSTLRANTGLYLSGDRIWLAIALHAFRIVATGGAFVLAVEFGGASAVLALFAGFLLARQMMVRTARGAP